MTPHSALDQFDATLEVAIDRQQGDHPRKAIGGDGVPVMFLGLLYIAKAIIIAARYLSDRADTRGG